MSELEHTYRKRLKNVLVPLASKLEKHLQELFGAEPRIDRIYARAKSVSSFMKKANTRENDKLKYADPLRQIQDQIGGRIIVFYTMDVERVTGLVEKYLHKIETREYVPDSLWTFGYIGRHYVMVLPADIIDVPNDEGVPEFFELQIKTLFQHAWSEANHKLGYKPEVPLEPDDERRLAFTAAQAWGADHIFNELFEEHRAKGEAAAQRVRPST